MKKTTYSPKRRLFAALVALLLFAAPVAAKVGTNLEFRRLLADQGISIGAVEVIFQDSHGYMWFGGDADNGLVKYDGYNFTIYRHEPGNPRSLSSSVVWDIHEDSRGDLWIATDVGLNRFERETGEFTRFKPSSVDPEAEAFTRAIVEDAEGQLWVGSFGGLLRFDHDTGQFVAHFHDPADSRSISANQVRTLLMDRDSGIWVGTERAGLNYFDTETEQFQRYPHGVTDESGIIGNMVLSLEQTSDGLLWVGTENGISVLNPATGRFRHIRHDPTKLGSPRQNIVDALAEDSHGNLWMGTEGGLNYLDRATGQFTTYQHNPNKPRSLANNVVRSLYLDDSGNLWIGNFPAGVNFLDRTNMAFSTYRHDPDDSRSLSQSSVLALHEAADGDLWLGTDGGGLNYFDREKGVMTHYLHQPGKTNTLSAGAVLSIEDAGQGRLWLGTWSGGLNLFDPESETFEHHRGVIGVSDNVWSLERDKDGTLWAGTVGGGIGRYLPEQNIFRHYQPESGNPHSAPSYVVWAVYEDHLGDIWAGTSEGLARYRPETDDFKVYSEQPGVPGTLGAKVVTHIAEDGQHRLWIATRGGGLNLFDRETETFTRIGMDDGLPTDIVMSVVADNDGNIWMGTTNGLSRYTPETGQVLNFNQDNGLQGNQFNIGAALKLSSGELAFGGIYGFTLFDPADIQPTVHVPPVAIVGFEIFNQPVPVGGEDSPLSKVVSQTDAITLSHEQSVFSFSFVAMSYSSPERNQYAYKLEGFEDQWNYIGNRRTATYTNLDPGSYVFHVKAANSQGLWNEEGSSIRLRILPPPWQTWWAYTLYSLMLAGAVIAFVRRQHTKVEVERGINRRLQQLDKLKDEFLANTSHELRTPLNGIIGLAESLAHGVGGPQSEVSQHNLDMIIASGRRLDRLVNDILDFAQLKEHSLSLRQKPLDMRALVEVVLALSRPLLGDKNLELVNAVDQKVPQVYADEDRVQQILHNLVGNAIKFTHEGSIRVSARLADASYLEVRVRDTGIGIPADALPHVFDAFHQVQGAADRSFGGTGLGLAVTKQLVELHGGVVQVESTPGRGSVFHFTLPLLEQVDPHALNTGVFTETEDIGTSDADTAPAVEVPAREVASMAPVPADEANPGHEHWHLLVVDDEPVNRQVLVNHLQLQRYQVTQAASGREALDLVADRSFDLILLDIMMPQLSGYEVCKQLRENFSSHELPVIFLTAKNQVNDLVTGFNLGANDFLTKPINRDELLARVATHLELLEIHRELEKKVTERTEALQQKHQQLEEAYRRLEDISLSDPLTGLSNRRYLQKLLPMDIARVHRKYRDVLQPAAFEVAEEPGQDLVFLLLDVDHFKSVNDAHGHSAGDQLLIQLSTLLTRISRDSDFLIRWGGEEFLIVSRFARRSDARQMAERIRRAVANHAFILTDGQILSKTCSIGYACYPFLADHPTVLSWEQVIDTADRALYAAKKSGRNRCVGLASTEQTSRERLHQQITNDVRGLIERGEIAVIADDAQELMWE